MDEHPIQGVGKSNGTSIATETGIRSSHLSSIGLYFAFTLIGFCSNGLCCGDHRFSCGQINVAH